MIKTKKQNDIDTLLNDLGIELNIEKTQLKQRNNGLLLSDEAYDLSLGHALQDEEERHGTCYHLYPFDDGPCLDMRHSGRSRLLDCRDNNSHDLDGFLVPLFGNRGFDQIGVGREHLRRPVGLHPGSSFLILADADIVDPLDQEIHVRT